jgi:predicted DNA-binding transcriptional regulator YafY
MKKFLENMERLRKINRRINEGNTGPAHLFAAEFNISVGTLNNDINRLRCLSKADGVTITYSTALKSYVYTRTGKFNFDWGFTAE